MKLFDGYTKEENDNWVSKKKKVLVQRKSLYEEIQKELEAYSATCETVCTTSKEVKKNQKTSSKQLKKLTKKLEELVALSVEYGKLVQGHIDWLDATDGIFMR